jgi:hypothetical protein
LILADQKYKAQVSLKLNAALARNPALAEKLIESKIQGLPAATANHRRLSIENHLIQSIQARIDRQRFIKPHRASASIAPVVPYNGGKPSPSPFRIAKLSQAAESTPPKPYPRYRSQLTITASSPTALAYLSILEDPLALDADVDAAAASDNDGTASDVYIADERYPSSTFPRRAWLESLIDTFGTSHTLFYRTQSTAYNVALFFGQAFALAVLVRLVLIATGTWALDDRFGGSWEVLWSALYMVHVGIGALYTRYTGVVEYWGRLIRVPMEFLANDPLFILFLAFCATTVWGLWRWLRGG